MSIPSLPPPDSSLVEDVIMSRLRDDPTLKAICPDGVWWDVGDEKARRFVVVSMIDHSDVPVFGGRAWENALYLVKAVMLNSAGGSVRAAAKQIDALLEDWQTAVEDFGHLSTHRETRVRITEQDSDNTAIRWLHRGGRYRAHAAIV